MTTTTLIQADARRIPLADRSVQCVVTSPPYFGLRDYGVHGQIGLESSVAEYVRTMVQVFREVRRVLRDDGTVWCNMGDSYASSGTMGYSSGLDEYAREHRGQVDNGPKNGQRLMGRAPTPDGLAPKNLLGIPWRLAFALQDDGWILRSDIVWSKPNPMPESVTDRPTKSHEYIFMLSKRERYFYDAEAVREGSTNQNGAAALFCRPGGKGRAASRNDADYRPREDNGSRNLRSVWTITPRPFAGAHFATFPSELVERCIKAGTSERGQCPTCGRAWERELEPIGKEISGHPRGKNAAFCAERAINGATPMKTIRLDRGWRPGCPCIGRTETFEPGPEYPDAEPITVAFPHEPVPQVVFDPFGGAGTVPLVASNMGRRGVMTELNPAYIDMARRRISRPHAKPERTAREEHHPLFSGIEP